MSQKASEQSLSLSRFFAAPALPSRLTATAEEHVVFKFSNV